MNLPKCLPNASLWRKKSAKDWGQSGMSFDNNSEILMYQTEDGKTKIDVRMENETV